jgi:membrane protease YdiL (CAAX protease family)
MPPIEPIELNPSRLYWFFYIGVVFVLGFILLINALKSARNFRPQQFNTILPWNISWLDFGFFSWIIFCWIIVSQWLSVFTQSDETNASTFLNSINTALLVGGSMHIGFILIFLSLPYFITSRSYKFPVNTIEYSFSRSFITAIKNCLIAIPPILIGAYIWKSFLIWLTELGFQIHIEEQDLIGYFTQTDSLTSYIFLVLLAVIIAPISEELIFRAGIYRFLKSRISPTNAMLLSSILFASLHMNIAGFLPLMLIGIALCMSYELTGNIMTAIFFHSLFNLNTCILIFLQPMQ